MWTAIDNTTIVVKGKVSNETYQIKISNWINYDKNIHYRIWDRFDEMS